MEEYSSMEPPKAQSPMMCIGTCSAAFCGALLATTFFFSPTPESRLRTSPSLRLVTRDTLGGPDSPVGKQVVVGMDTNVDLHIAWNDWAAFSKEMSPWWTEEFVYDFNYVGPWGFGPTTGLRAWYEGEHLHFNAAIPDSQWQDFIRAATDVTATSASYGLARWTGEFAGVPPPSNHPKVRIHDLDFYVLEGNRIKKNWCIVDVVNLFEQVGYQVVPKGPLPYGGYQAPDAMDGFPAPLSSMFTKEHAAESEQVWLAALRNDYDEGAGGGKLWADSINWYGPGGVGTARSKEEYVKHWLNPLHAAFSNITRETDLVVCEGPYCGAHFYLWGTHVGEWMGEQPTGKRVPIRCGAHARIVNGVILEGWLIIDHARAFLGMGVDLYSRARAIALAVSSESAEQSDERQTTSSA
eukprot:TRINITY_DN30270_c1_g4_i3.p1 TRINITY_DN30270_c1_g4~~TRINITY_DN30270_c1_g4_i3.p1  ORF type:complete len:424 (+),score=38.74 TRINITY_DN30270_c1_g4_i3:47-1273(+)